MKAKDKRAMIKRLKMIHGSGNVFRDIGFPEDE
jgi:hypothetical protein